MSKTQQEAPMPVAYRTPSGRVVTANPALHRMVVEQKGKYGSYAPCDDSGRVEAGAHGEEAVSLSAEAAEKAKQEGIEQGWAEAKQSLGEAIEEAKAAAFEEGKAAGAKEAEAAASNKASPKTKAADK